VQVPGEFRPPAIGIHVEPYPISGRGLVETRDGALHVAGAHGIPWQV